MFGYDGRDLTIPAPAGGFELEAVQSDGGGRPAVVAPPHPLYGGSLANPVVVALYTGLAAAGLAPLAFNWRGVGESGGSASDDIDDAVADYGAAAALLAADDGYVAAGYSFGAATAVAHALGGAKVSGLVLVAPPLAMMEAIPLEDVACPLSVIVGSEDMFAPSDVVRTRVGSVSGARLEILDGIDHFFSRGGIDRVESFTEESARAL